MQTENGKSQKMLEWNVNTPFGAARVTLSKDEVKVTIAVESMFLTKSHTIYLEEFKTFVNQIQEWVCK